MNHLAKEISKNQTVTSRNPHLRELSVAVTHAEISCLVAMIGKTLNGGQQWQAGTVGIFRW